jgi:hypothetical protein
LDNRVENVISVFMNPPKCNEYDYTDFLMASPKSFSSTEAEKVQPDQEYGPSHDPINRVLYRLSSDTEALWHEAARFTGLSHGFLIPDDSASDKPSADKIQMVTYHPVRQTSQSCKRYQSRKLGRQWLTRLKADHSVNPDGKGNVALSEAGISGSGTAVHLKGYGFIRVSGIAAEDGSTGYRATSDPDTDELGRLQLSDFSWKIEEYHRGLKQFCGAERSFVRLAGAQRNHIGLAIRAFLRFEVFSLKTGYSRFEAEMRIIRDAIRAYLANPVYALQATA